METAILLPTHPTAFPLPCPSCHAEGQDQPAVYRGYCWRHAYANALTADTGLPADSLPCQLCGADGPIEAATIDGLCARHAVALERAYRERYAAWVGVLLEALLDNGIQPPPAPVAA